MAPKPEVIAPIYKGLRERGFGHIPALAFLGNAYTESSYNPAAFNEAGGGQGALGLWQWRGDRQRGLKHMATENGVAPESLDAQLDWLAYEAFKDPHESKIMAALEGVNDPIEASRIVRRDFERPGSDEAGYARMDRHMRELNAMFGGPTIENAERENNPLRDWALRADEHASETTKAIETIAGADPEGGLEKARKENQGRGISLPPGVGLPAMRSGTQLGFGGGIPSMRQTFPTTEKLAFGQNQTPAAAAGLTLPPNTNAPGDFAGNPPPPNQVTSTSNSEAATEEEAEPERMGLFDRIGSWLFPKHEDPGESFSNLLGGLGVGLGQMSHGQPVDLQPYWNNIRETRERAASAAAEAEQQGIDNAMKMGQLRVSQGQLAVAEANSNLAAIKQMAELNPNVPFTPEQLETYANDPETAGFASWIGSPDPLTREEGIKGLRKVLEGRAEQQASGNPGYAKLYDALKNGAPINEVADLMATSGLEPTEMTNLINAAGETPSSLHQRAQEILKEGGGVGKNLGQMMETLAGLDAGLRPQTVSQEMFNEGMKRFSSLSEAASSANNILPAIESARSATEAIIASNRGKGDTNILTGMLAKAQSIADGVFGFNTVEEFIANFSGASIEHVDQLDAAEKVLLFEIGRQKMEGQGSVSDSERTSLAKSLISGSSTSQQRLHALNRLEVFAEVDRMAFDHYNNTSGEDFQNLRGSMVSHNEIIEPIKRELIQKLTMHDKYANSAETLLDIPDMHEVYQISIRDPANASPEEKKLIDDAREVIKHEVSPRLTMEQARYASDILNRRGITSFYNTETKRYEAVPNPN